MLYHTLAISVFTYGNWNRNLAVITGPQSSSIYPNLCDGAKRTGGRAGGGKKWVQRDKDNYMNTYDSPLIYNTNEVGKGDKNS